MNSPTLFALAALITALATLVTALKTRKEVKLVHVLFNSRMDQLLKKTEESAHAEGVKEEKEKH